MELLSPTLFGTTTQYSFLMFPHFCLAATLKFKSLYDNNGLKTHISTIYQLNIGNAFFRSNWTFLNCTQQIVSKDKNLYWSTELNTIEKLRSWCFLRSPFLRVNLFRNCWNYNLFITHLSRTVHCYLQVTWWYIWTNQTFGKWILMIFYDMVCAWLSDDWLNVPRSPVAWHMKWRLL